MEKIAVLCESAEEWASVEEEAFKRGNTWSGGKDHKKWWYEDKCINISSMFLSHAEKSYYEGEGYAIITVAEYLSEGGKDVSKFNKGERVECTNKRDSGKFGKIYTVSRVGDNSSLALKGVSGGCIYDANFFKPISNKPSAQTIKENDMNTSIETVFADDKVKEGNLVQKYFGSEIKEDFTGELSLTLHKQAYLDEAKRREKAAKDADK